RMFLSKTLPNVSPDFIDFFPENYTVRPGEINILKDTVLIFIDIFKIQGLFISGLNNLIINYNNLPGIDIPDILRTNNVKSCCFRCKNNALSEPSHTQRPNPVRIAHCNQFCICENAY